MKKLIFSLLAASCLSACTHTDNNQVSVIKQSQTDINHVSDIKQSPKNIIMVVADGMGPAYTTAYRYFNDNPDTEIIEETVFDRHLVGLSSTYPAKESGYITDSAASATALSTGVKTYNGAIGVDVKKQPVQTVLEWAKLQDKRTGVVVTSQINHATPASYLAHNEHRRNYNAIADDYIDEGIKADVYLGGGWEYFIREDRNLVNEFKQNGFHYVDTYQALQTAPENTPLLGLFDDTGLPSALDDSNPHRLSLMTNAALKQLENDNGFFMLVEASQVDWAGHGNDIATAMAEMDDLAKTMELLEDYVNKNPDTLVVLTADHSTGGFTIAANGNYAWKPDVIRTMTMTPKAIAKELTAGEFTAKDLSDKLNFNITEEEFSKLTQATNDAKDKQKALTIALKKLIDVRTNTGWTTSGHTGIDVPVFAMGHSYKAFQGELDNTAIAKIIFTLLGKK